MIREYIRWRISLFRKRLAEHLRWRVKLMEQSWALARLLAGDWWCYTVHMNGYLCHCGREWRGNVCVSRSWCQDMRNLTEDYSGERNIESTR